jgi:hypothetical protein
MREVYTTVTTGETYAGDSDMDDTQVQAHSDGEYATPEEMIDYVDPARIPEHTTDFYTAKIDQTREIGVPRFTAPVTGYVLGGGGFIAGYSFAETSGVANQSVTLIFHDGTDANAPVILAVGIPAGQSDSTWYLPGGLRFRNGIYIVVTGSYQGALYLRDDLKL